MGTLVVLIVAKDLPRVGEYVERAREAVALGGRALDECFPVHRQVSDAPNQAVFKVVPDAERVLAFDEILRGTPSSGGEVPAGYFLGENSLEWPLPPRECMGSPLEDYLHSVRPGLQWKATSKCEPTTEGRRLARTPSPGYFIGRDGIKWPLPPAECMSERPVLKLTTVSHSTSTITTPSPTSASATTSNYDGGACTKASPGHFMGRDGIEWPHPPAEWMDPAILKIYHKLPTTSYSPPASAKPGHFVGRGGLEWPYPPLECLDPAVLEAHRDSPAPTSSEADGTHHSAESECHALPASVATSTSSLSTDSTNSMLPPTPHCGPLELGGLRSLPSMGGAGQHSPVATHAEFALVAKTKAANAVCPRLAFWIGGLDDTDADACGENGRSPVVEGDSFRGKDGTWWPLPPSPPLDDDSDQDEELDWGGYDERRGRSPTPKWSMLCG